MKLKLKRDRYIVTRERNGNTEIWCGLARNYTFKPIREIGSTEIKTYRSEAQARSAIEWNWRNYDEFQVRRVLVTMEEMEDVL